MASVVVLVLVEAPILAVSARCAREQNEREGEDEDFAMARRRRHRTEDTGKTLLSSEFLVRIPRGGPLNGVDSALAVSRKPRQNTCCVRAARVGAGYLAAKNET